jgi:predicted negative regulator of RcsB-dependent stress response
MSILAIVGVVVLIVAAVAAYQVFKSKKAVTASSVVAQASADVAAVKSDVKKV